MPTLPLSQHPSLTVLVDDSESFLRSLAFQLGPEQPSIAFNEARQAIDWMRRQQRPRRHALAAHVDSGSCTVSCDVSAIHTLAFDVERFSTPSVLVVDYSMPQMNGLEFCEAIRDLPCKKILFTGAADEKIAIDAFHRGLIDRYFRKGERDALGMLETEITRLQQAFFVDRDRVLRELLGVQYLGFVNHGAVAALVTELCLRHGFVEHYVFADPAGVLLLNADGEASLLVVQSSEDLRAQYEMAVDNGAPASLLTALQERLVVPFFPGPDGMYNASHEANWYRHVQPARRLDESADFYWALFPMARSHLAQPVTGWRQHQMALRLHAGSAMAAV